MFQRTTTLLCIILSVAAATSEPVWTSCPTYTAPERLRPELLNPNLTSDCTFVQLPLDYDMSSPFHNQTIQIFLRRVNARVSPPKGQLILLQGGPGAPGTAFEENYNDFMKSTNFEFELLVPDHRGVGLSTPMTCNGTTTVVNAAQCAAELRATWGDAVLSFNVQNAARDVGELVRLFRREDTPIFVFGVSYGTYLALRYLNFHPNQATGVILDSPIPPKFVTLAYFDLWAHTVGMNFLSLCGMSSWKCRKAFGRFPSDYAVLLFNAIDLGQNQCSVSVFGNVGTKIMRKNLRMLFFILVGSEDLRVLVPPIIHRFVRCNTEDVAVLTRLWAILGPALNFDLSTITFHIGASELFGMNKPQTILTSSSDALVFSAEAGPDVQAIADLMNPSWPIYPTDSSSDPTIDIIPNTEIPVLILAGELDPQTDRVFGPLLAEKYYNNRYQFLVNMPFAPHAMMFNGRVSDDLDVVSCGMMVIGSFVRAGGRRIDDSCTRRVLAPDFDVARENTVETVAGLFGTEDAWGLDDDSQDDSESSSGDKRKRRRWRRRRRRRRWRRNRKRRVWGREHWKRKLHRWIYN